MYCPSNRAGFRVRIECGYFLQLVVFTVVFLGCLGPGILSTAVTKFSPDELICGDQIDVR